FKDPGWLPVDGCLPFEAGLSVAPGDAAPAGAAVLGVVCCAFRRRNPPGESGFAGGACGGLGVVAALDASAAGNVGARTAGAPAARPMAGAVTPAFVPEGSGAGGTAGGGPPGVGGGIAAIAATGVTVWV